MSNKSWFHCVLVKHSSSSSSSSSDSSSSSSSESEDEVNRDRIQDLRPCVTQTKTFLQWPFTESSATMCVFISRMKRRWKKNVNERSHRRGKGRTPQRKNPMQKARFEGENKRKYFLQMCPRVYDFKMFLFPRRKREEWRMMARRRRWFSLIHTHFSVWGLDL